MEGNVNWITLGILGLMVVIWATKFLTAIRLKQKLKKAWDGAPFFRKKDTEESLIDSLAYPAKGKTIDSQVDDQTWHDLALDAVFDQLNYTQSSLGAEALYQKMRLLEFQPQDQLHDLEAFFDFLLLVELLSLAVVSSVELPALYVACSASVSFVVLISYLFFAPVLDVTTTAV